MNIVELHIITVELPYGELAEMLEAAKTAELQAMAVTIAGMKCILAGLKTEKEVYAESSLDVRG